MIIVDQTFFESPKLFFLLLIIEIARKQFSVACYFVFCKLKRVNLKIQTGKIFVDSSTKSFYVAFF